MYVCMHVCMHACACMYICICICSRDTAGARACFMHAVQQNMFSYVNMCAGLARETERGGGEGEVEGERWQSTPAGMTDSAPASAAAAAASDCQVSKVRRNLKTSVDSKQQYEVANYTDFCTCFASSVVSKLFCSLSGGMLAPALASSSSCLSWKIICCASVSVFSWKCIRVQVSMRNPNMHAFDSNSFLSCEWEKWPASAVKRHVNTLTCSRYLQYSWAFSLSALACSILACLSLDIKSWPVSSCKVMSKVQVYRHA